MATEDTASLLAQLREIHLPDAPAAPTVTATVVALLLLAAVLLLQLYKRRTKTSSWSSEAVAELNHIHKAQASDTLLQTAALLKRVVLTHDASVKHHTGETWLHTLDTFFNTTYFSCGAGRIFGERLYTIDVTVPDNLHRDLKKLIRRRKWQR